MAKTYPNPSAFEQALKARVKRRAREMGVGFNRVLQIVLFERFLARVYEAVGDAVILKGGFAMELRLSRARTTKDIDMRIEGALDDVVDRLRAEAAKQRDDYLTFAFVGEEDFKEMVGEQVVYGGRRLRVQAQLAARPFGSIFMLDLSVSDKLLLPPDTVTGSNLLEFIGIEPLEHRVYPVEAHVAEKLHAMTMTYEGAPSGRVKDLVDIGLLALHSPFEAATLRQSIVATFDFRDTHSLPPELPQPPEFWEALYNQMREEDDLPWQSLADLQNECVEFLNPVLQERLGAGDRWRPDKLEWAKYTG
ncbi:nucleotidyl transferase AbiEii/AbiGii toxin family protein [Persicimonas caeni]|uniref:Nucleotidyl transferase AbiEii/AbiGii toxin family protein n=1 Tax=Persicimonas caeni TaxID=2292766 RepID=A0A4Y6PUU8_PERCE|nr:nucleotidyl transferase AbiEii/AbiGii toxin family protein [Persicimonas caeni]QDG52088.1 nucleotidyl transferase AbiEii/AbiGii toxin family protein [Persicimonas caeni]QED33309.1 nucleotidyl transferase AbiEii/AbiGii toxin family protein [Persicimonas caeni]